MNNCTINDIKNESGAFWRRRLVGNGNSYQITIPAEFVTYSGWKRGDTLRIGVRDGILYVSREGNDK
jgi:hypothetical protein